MKRLKFVTLVGLGACAAVAAGCAVGSENETDNQTDSVSQALGQPSGDFPSYDERVALYGSNRGRMNPAAEGWPTYAAQPPLQWNLSLNQSSRAHSLDMRDTPCFQHPSCGSTTDDTFTRVRMFYTAAARGLAENIAGGPADGLTVVHNWINEIGAAAGETGHRDSTFSGTYNLVGLGYAPGGPPRPALNNLWTQDFVGTGTALALPKMTDGIHFPATVAAGGSVSFGTTYYDAAGAAPSRIMVVVDGTCTPMVQATALAMPRGTPGKGTYEVAVPLAAGCHPYYFLATAAGVDVSYPDSGALQVGVAVAAGSCALFATTRASVVCGAGGGGLGGSSGAGGATGGTGGAAGTSGAGGGTGTGAGGAPGSGGAPGGGGAPGSGGAPGNAGSPGSADGGTTPGTGGAAGNGAAPTTVSGGCGCSVPTRGSDAGGASISLLAGALGLLFVRRRRAAPPGQQPPAGQQTPPQDGTESRSRRQVAGAPMEV